MENIPCEPSEDCKYFPDCFEDTHHQYYPRRRYTGKLARDFRQLPEHQAEVCRAEHDEIHATERLPEKPTRAFMLVVVQESL